MKLLYRICCLIFAMIVFTACPDHIDDIEIDKKDKTDKDISDTNDKTAGTTIHINYSYTYIEAEFTRPTNDKVVKTTATVNGKTFSKTWKSTSQKDGSISMYGLEPATNYDVDIKHLDSSGNTISTRTIKVKTSTIPDLSYCLLYSDLGEREYYFPISCVEQFRQRFTDAYYESDRYYQKCLIFRERKNSDNNLLNFQVDYPYYQDPGNNWNTGTYTVSGDRWYGYQCVMNIDGNTMFCDDGAKMKISYSGGSYIYEMSGMCGTIYSRNDQKIHLKFVGK